MTDAALPFLRRRGPAPELGEVFTPAGLQSRAVLVRRRILSFLVMGATLALVLYGASLVFGADGWNVSDVVIMICISFGAPWTIMGVWNAGVGMWLAHFARDGLVQAAPHLADEDASAPIRLETAVLMFLRNEDADRALARLAEVRRSLDATGEGSKFDFYLLSDSSDPAAIAREEAALARWRPALGDVTYRRRERNEGYKAGNVRDFLRRWGSGHDLFLPLDSDSLMSGEMILRMVRIIQKHPRLGILQSLATGTPSRSAFGRIFQFGMRHGMRTNTLGAAWWHGDCGPYWGHNALVRTAPFRAKCRLPVLPGKAPLGGHILSHDSVEAALMRRAGYEVRIIPQEAASWEDNPPHLTDYSKRDLRWCQGNLQHIRLLALPGLRPMSRFQLFTGIAMYFAAPAWMLMTLAAISKIVDGQTEHVNLALGLAMFLVMFAMSLAPKVAGWIDIAMTEGMTARYGGRARFMAGALMETVFSIMLAPVEAMRVSIFMVGLLFGRTVSWNGQNRDVQAMSWSEAAAGLWPQTLFGVSLAVVCAIWAPLALPWAAPVLVGLILAMPFAVLTADPRIGEWTVRHGLCGLPEERTGHEALRAIDARAPISAADIPLVLRPEPARAAEARAA